jgi:DNA-binding transcriptional LysR family regulator
VVLNTNRLRVLREVAARGTITAAAEALFLTPPAVSHQLAVLEREVGIPLLERSARAIRLTDAGARLVEHAETILADCELALADLETFTEEVSGTVHLSAFQTAAQAIAVPAVATLRRRYPGLEVLVSEVDPLDSIAALKAGRLDMALSHEWDLLPMPPDPGIDRHDLLTEPAVVLLPAGHPLAGKPVRLADLARERWCVAKETATTRLAVENAANAAGFSPRVVLESNYFGVIALGVQAGLGVGIVPRMTDLRGVNVAVQPLVAPTLSRRIFAAVRQGSGAAPKLRAVLDALAEAASATGGRPADADDGLAPGA